MAKHKKGKGKKIWSFSLSSLILMIYAAVQFGLLDIVNLFMKGTTDLNAYASTLLKNFTVAKMMNVMITGLQVKILAAIPRALGQGTIGQFWKFRMRW